MPSTVLQDKFSGINQRSLKTEGVDFSKFNGCFPSYAGIQSRIFGKQLLGKFDAPVYSIFQFWTPQGYIYGLQQTDQVSLTPWTPWNPIIPVTGGLPTIPTTIITYPPSNSGWKGCTGLSYGYIYQAETHFIEEFVVSCKNYTNTIPGGPVILQGCGGWIPDVPTDPVTGQYIPPNIPCVPFGFPDIGSPTKPDNITGTIFSSLNAGSNRSSEIRQLNNMSGFPPNYFIQQDSLDGHDFNVVVELDLSSLYATGEVVYLTSTFTKNINGVITTQEVAIGAGDIVDIDKKLTLDSWSLLPPVAIPIPRSENDNTGEHNPTLRALSYDSSASSLYLNVYRKIGIGFSCPISF